MIDRSFGKNARSGEAGMAGPDHDDGVLCDYATSTVTFTGLVMMS